MLALLAVVGCENRAQTQVAPEPPSVATLSQAAAVAAQRIEVGDNGFQPVRVSLGADRKLVFRRTTESTCATAVVFPSLGIEKPLPLNADVVVDLPATLEPEVAFQCGMGMLRGKVVAR